MDLPAQTVTARPSARAIYQRPVPSAAIGLSETVDLLFEFIQSVKNPRFGSLPKRLSVVVEVLRNIITEEVHQ
jgi:hypothetical protein